MGASAITSAMPQRYLKVKNRNNIPMHVPIYTKFGKKARNMVRKMPIKFKAKILKITFVTKYIGLGRFGHVSSKLRKLSPLGSRSRF